MLAIKSERTINYTRSSFRNQFFYFLHLWARAVHLLSTYTCDHLSWLVRSSHIITSFYHNHRKNLSIACIKILTSEVIFTVKYNMPTLFLEQPMHYTDKPWIKQLLENGSGYDGCEIHYP